MYANHPAAPRPLLRRTASASADNSPPLRRLPGVLALAGLPAAALGIAIARGGLNNPWVYPLLGMTLLANVSVILMDIRYGLALFILTAGISPKLPGGGYDNLRVEDFVFVVVFGCWLARTLQHGRLPRLRNPMVLPFLVLTGVSVLSTAWGVVIGQVPDLTYSAFLQLKRVEYFLIFWVVASTIRSNAWLRALTLTLIISGALAGAYGLANPQSSYQQTVAATRVVGPEGENYNTLAGYLVICIAAGLASLRMFPSGILKVVVIVSTAVTLGALLLSFSREGYIMLVGSVMVFGITKHKAILFGAAIALVAIFFASGQVRQNVVNTVTQVQNAQTDDPGSNSLTARFNSWSYRWNGWFVRQPLIGNGVGAVALSVDNEYLLRLCEVGILGTAVFVWWLVSIGQQVKALQRVRGIPQLLASGLGAAFVGMLIQATVATSFNTIRTMEPFWFLLGMVSAAATIHYASIRESAAKEANACVQ